MKRQEHPRPQFMRDTWKNLNGIWQFEIDFGRSGEARGLYKNSSVLEKTIEVPFCPESALSGVEYKDFMESVWYRRSFELTETETAGRVVLHFGAADYETVVYVNERRVGRHIGGYVSFEFDITDYVKVGENTVTVQCNDDTRDGRLPSGKQSPLYHSHGCMYTRTTGIWQTVWLELTPKAYIESVHYLPNAEAGTLTVEAELIGKGELAITAAYDGADMGCASVLSDGGHVALTLTLAEKHLWTLGVGGLYDLTLIYGDDRVKSYFGLRDIDYRDKKFYLNGKSVFQRLVLDQGFYPDGIYTAPSDEELALDIDRSMAMGFNGARLHEKIFEERFLYHADKKGYIVWGEYPNWGLDISRLDSLYTMLPEWIDEVKRDRNHPSVVGWCPFNETWDTDGRRQINAILSTVYHATKAIDPARPCIDTSGNYHVITDIYDVHNYEQNSEIFASHYKDLAENGSHWDHCGERQHYDGKSPFFVSEYGGIRWTEDQSGWGYGNAPTSEEEFLSRLKGLNDALLDNEAMFGFCYTQLTDVEQEQNGLYTYDRKPKFPPETIRPLFARKAAVEE